MASYQGEALRVENNHSPQPLEDADSAAASSASCVVIRKIRTIRSDLRKAVVSSRWIHEHEREHHPKVEEVRNITMAIEVCFSGMLRDRRLLTDELDHDEDEEQYVGCHAQCADAQLMLFINIKYRDDDGFEYTQPCERRAYGTGLRKKWCRIQPVS